MSDEPQQHTRLAALPSSSSPHPRPTLITMVSTILSRAAPAIARSARSAAPRGVRSIHIENTAETVSMRDAPTFASAWKLTKSLLHLRHAVPPVRPGSKEQGAHRHLPDYLPYRRLLAALPGRQVPDVSRREG